MKTSESIEVTKRFFQAVDHLIKEKEFDGVRDFCRKFEMNTGYYYNMRNTPETHSVKVDQLVRIVKTYNVSATWLLIGTGSMMVSED
ncbi:hypothetical protein FEM33_01730 [Dyadobacter flavalbus]|uniref:Helix-turn-helix transcriptional regulator n=1 Tax=Dyadobacter flavalbus TaxID=2579942 RepID=A0A5M8R1D7_9BACT|nr:hypothetical protein [Dyadobacter flavalbus]KAA6441481.1 hypothetical protein FEM33_01730 [Dyadobacter flavalbus]